MKAPRISKGRGRSVKEWVGRSPDSVPPSHVRLRIFDRHGGICHISGVKIMPGDAWDLDHIIRLEDGGENRESNLAPALRQEHREKTAEETRRGKKADRVRSKHVGITNPKRPIKSRGFPRTGREPRIPKNPITHLPTPIQRQFLSQKID